MLAPTLREWFAKEDSWCQRYSCTTKFGATIGLIHREDLIEKMCLNGAIHSIYGSSGWNGYFAPDVSQVIQRVREALSYANHIDWNDSPERRIDDIRKLVNDLLI